MTWILSLPLELRMAAMALLGVLVGTQVNRGIYRLAWFRREIGPWSPPAPHAPPRTARDRIPILGWWFLRRESPLHGRGFWIRPLLLELAMGIGFAALYWYEVDRGAVFPLSRAVFIPDSHLSSLVLHLQLLSHLVLVSLMMVATFIDLDEQTIPDAITIPGTILGLMLAVLFPQSRALVMVASVIGGGGYRAEFLHLCSGTGRPGASDWPTWLNGSSGLLLGLSCCAAWCLALIPWTWTVRRGWLKGIQFWLASIARRGSTVPIAVMGTFLAALIVWIWSGGGTRWESLLSSLVGMAVGGATIWAVRIIGTVALRQEAMGFGDVTLMAMIGSFTGWQPTLIIFFLAPFSAIFIAIAQFAVTRRHDIAFGPYLCLASVFWILRSGDIWRDYGLPIYSMGWYVPAIGISGLLLMGGMLQAWRLIRDVLFPWDPDEDPAAPLHPEAPGAVGANGEWNHRVIPARGVAGDHPLRKSISLQPPQAPIPGSRHIGHRPPGSQLFRS